MEIEAIIVSTSNGGTTMYDSKNQTVLGRYKTPAMKKNSCQTLKNQLLVCTDRVKPFLYVYQFNKSEEEQSCRILLSHKCGALGVSADSSFIIMAVQNDLQILHVESQRITSSPSPHFQSISTIKCSPDGSMFATGADDGMVLVWDLSRALQSSQEKRPNTYASFSDHSLPITDLMFSHCSYRPLLASASIDRTLKIYDLNTKKPLLNIVFQHAVTSVTFGRLDSDIFVGNNKGDIFKVDLCVQPRSFDLFENSAKSLAKFNACHVAEITCMVVSKSSKELVTGSSDSKLVIWNISTGRALQVIEMKSAVCSIIVTRVPKSVLEVSPPVAEVLRTVKQAKRGSSEKKLLEVTVVDGREREIKYDRVAGACPIQQVDSNEKEINELLNINNELFHYYRRLIENSGK